MSGLFEAWEVESHRRNSIVPILALVGLVLLVGEIAFRRLHLADLPIWGRLAASLARWRPRWWPRRRAATPGSGPEAEAVASTGDATMPLPEGEVVEPLPLPRVSPPSPPREGLRDAMRRAKGRVDDRFGRDRS
jgi:hypothetical protein